MEFSNISLCLYGGHKSLINDIFLNPNINTFVSYDDKYLHSWNPANKKLISSVNFTDPDVMNLGNVEKKAGGAPAKAQPQTI